MGSQISELESGFELDPTQSDLSVTGNPNSTLALALDLNFVPTSPSPTIHPEFIQPGLNTLRGATMAHTHDPHRRTPSRTPQRAPAANSRRRLWDCGHRRNNHWYRHLRTPGLVAAQLSTPGLIISVWLAGGIYAFCCTLTGVVCHRSRFDMRAVGEGSAFLAEIVLGVAVAPSRGR